MRSIRTESTLPAARQAGSPFFYASGSSSSPEPKLGNVTVNHEPSPTVERTEIVPKFRPTIARTDGKAESRAACLTAAGLVNAVKAVENRVQCVFGNAAAGILYINDNSIFLMPHPNMGRCRFPGYI